MTGYTRKWDCLLCKEHQDTIDSPRTPVCHRCLEPLARHLCEREMAPVTRSDGKPIWEHPAINHQHFMREAANIAWLLIARGTGRRQ